MDSVRTLVEEWQTRLSNSTANFETTKDIGVYIDIGVTISMQLKCSVSGNHIRTDFAKLCDEIFFFRLKRMLNRFIVASQGHMKLCPHHLPSLEELILEISESDDTSTDSSESTDLD